MKCNLEEKSEFANLKYFGLEHATVLALVLKCSLICVDHDELLILSQICSAPTLASFTIVRSHMINCIF